MNPTTRAVTIKKSQLNIFTKITPQNLSCLTNIPLITIMNRYSNFLYTTPLHSFQQMMILLSDTPAVYHQRTTLLPKNFPINCRQVITTMNRRNLLLRTTFANEQRHTITTFPFFQDRIQKIIIITMNLLLPTIHVARKGKVSMRIKHQRATLLPRNRLPKFLPIPIEYPIRKAILEHMPFRTVVFE